MDYAGNSNKAKEEAEEKTSVPAKPEKNLEKVVTGKVVQKERGFGRKFKDVFFQGESIKSVSQYVFWEKMLPSVRDMVFDLWSESGHRALYGSGIRKGSDQRRQRVSYNNPMASRRMADPRTQDQRGTRLPHQPPHPYRQNRREANDIVMASKEDAQSVLDTMIECVDKYGVVSLADLYELVGLPLATIDQKWGWTYLTSADIRQVREGFLLELPPMEEI